MDDISELIGMWDKLSPGLKVPAAIIIGLLCVCAVVSLVVNIWLAISYHKYNKQRNSVGLTGEQIARRVLDDNGLQNIKVSATGSLLFGNSYSHYFHKVRLRRLTWKKDSVSSMAMAVQKSCLAILDKEQDPDMLARIKMTPFIYFGPLACIPLIIIGVLLDIFVLKTEGVCTIACSAFGIAMYALSFAMAVKVLKTEKKAQERAYKLAEGCGLATPGEIEDMKTLFRLYNIEYINDMITALLELLLRILTIVAKVQANSSSSKD